MTLRLAQRFCSMTLFDVARSSQQSMLPNADKTTILKPHSSRYATSTSSIVHNSALAYRPALVAATAAPLRSFHAPSSRVDFRLGPPLFAEPLKKKRKIDPAILKRREDRIRGKIQRALDRLGRFAEKLKPIDEFEVPRALMKEREARTRVLEPLSFEESEKRARLERQFSEKSAEMYRVDVQQIKRVRESQRRALAELRAESEELYLKAIETDEGMMGLASPIITATPPIPDYEAPDGEHTDITKTFEYEVDFMTVLEANMQASKPKWQLKKEAKEAAALLEDDDDIKKEKKKKDKKQTSTVPPPLNP